MKVYWVMSGEMEVSEEAVAADDKNCREDADDFVLMELLEGYVTLDDHVSFNSVEIRKSMPYDIFAGRP